MGILRIFIIPRPRLYADSNSCLYK